MWKSVKIGDVAKAVGGSGFPKKYQTNTDKPIPFFKVSDMNIDGNEIEMCSANNYVDDVDLAEMKAKCHPAGTIIFPKIGGAISTNKKRILKSIAAFDNNVMGVIPNTSLILPEFLYKIFLSLDLYELSNKAALPSITNGAVEEVEILLPSVSEQQRIVTKLDAAFAEIDVAISTTKNKVNEVASLFEVFLTSTIENINSPCRKLSLDDIAKFLDYRGKTPKKTDSGVVLLTAKNVRMGYIKAEPQEFISKEEYTARMTRGFPKLGDVVFTTEAPLGLVAQIEDETVALGQRLITFQIRNKVIQNTYLKYALMSRHYQQEIYANGTGATVKGIKASLLKKIQITFPTSIEEQTKKVESLKIAEEKTNELLALQALKLVELDKLKSAILAHELQSEAA